jgi:hypothetical protein
VRGFNLKHSGSELVTSSTKRPINSVQSARGVIITSRLVPRSEREAVVVRIRDH